LTSSLPSNLPKLLYIGDVPVESTVAGSALLYRLLMTYPPQRLRVLQPTYISDSPEHRIPAVDYRKMRFGNHRLLHSRFTLRYSAHLARAARHVTSRAISTSGAKDFAPDAVLTVAHAYLWQTAAAVARRLNLPLHLIVHDDAVFSGRTTPSASRKLNEVYANVYRTATSRLCVSPYMVAEYQNRYGIGGDVLYPGRAADFNGFDSPPPHLAQTGRPLTYAYAGSLHTVSYVRSLAMLSNIAASRNDRLLIFSNISNEAAAKAGLAAPHVELSPIIPFRKLIDILRERVDILFVPMSFDEPDRYNMQVAFPSKLTDYTAIGLPLLIQGPPYCSAVRWAAENPGVAVTVENDDPAALTAAVASLADPQQRIEKAQAAIRIGREFFSHDAIFAKFLAAISPRFTA
jgi:hypothetical protein